MAAGPEAGPVEQRRRPTVIHERSGWGERKNARIGKVVWVSSTSANHASHCRHSSVSRYWASSMRW